MQEMTHEDYIKEIYNMMQYLSDDAANARRELEEIKSLLKKNEAKLR